MPRSAAVRAMRMAISPRLAMSSFVTGMENERFPVMNGILFDDTRLSKRANFGFGTLAPAEHMTEGSRSPAALRRPLSTDRRNPCRKGCSHGDGHKGT